MNWQDDILNNFGRIIGIEQLRFDDNNSLVFGINEQMKFVLERKEEEVLIYILLSMGGYYNVNCLIKALKLCHYKQPHLFSIQSGLKDSNTLCLCVCLSNESFTEDNLIKIMNMLISEGENVLAE